MSGPDPHQVGRLHLILLRVAGHGPDDLVAAARMSLAAGKLADTAAMIAATGLALPAEDTELISVLAPHSTLSIVPGQAPDGYEFVPLEPDIDPSQPLNSPPVIDLTFPQPWTPADAIDEADAAAVAATARTAGAVALWRAWRVAAGGDPVRVYLLEADLPVDRLPEVAAALHQALTRAEVASPQIEVYGPGVELYPYQRHARSGSALLWTAAPGDPPRIARVFDRVDPRRGPVFDTGHTRLDDPAILSYLDAGTVVLATTEQAGDVVDSARGNVVPMTYRTDGAWIWTDTVSYYLREHSLAPDADLVAHIRAAGAPPAVSAVAIHRALATLFAPATRR